MPNVLPAPKEALARSLAMMVAANGRIDAKELDVLDTLGAFGRVGVSRERFIDIACDCVAEVGAYLCDRSWLSVDHVRYLNTLLDAVTDTQDRLLLCRLAAAVITADGQVTSDERLVYDHALARWRIRQSDVSRAILADPVN